MLGGANPSIGKYQIVFVVQAILWPTQVQITEPSFVTPPYKVFQFAGSVPAEIPVVVQTWKLPFVSTMTENIEAPVTH
jgi:hypothetical protein